MLTGVETAGLVLATLPLFISALEHYMEGLEPIKLFFDFDNQLASQIRRLMCQHVNYELTLRLLLSGIAEGDELEEMIANPFDSNVWKDTTVQETLKARLRESYSVYERTVQHMQDLMQQLAKKLTIDHRKTNDLADLVATHPRRNGKYMFTNRVKFSMSRKKMKALLDELDDCNRQLDGFTNKTGQLDSFESTSKSKSSLPYTNQVRSYAKGLYRVICLGSACQVPHRARLQLEERSKIKRGQASNISPRAAPEGKSRISFTVSFLQARNTTSWQTTRTFVVKAEDLPRASSTTRGSGQRTARFASGPPDRSRVNHQNLPLAEDICSYIRQRQYIQQDLGFCIDCDGKLRAFYPFGDPRQKYNDTISLSEILSSTPTSRATSLGQRLNLGTIISSSYLQLQATPWLDGWSGDNILFDGDRTNEGRDNSTAWWFDVDRPYISHVFQPQTSSALTTPDNAQSGKKTTGNSSLLALGILLMELYTGQTFDQYRSKSSLVSSPMPPAGTVDDHLSNIHNMYAAHRWLEELKEGGCLSYAYTGAVQRCLQGYLDLATGEEEEAAFRQKIMDCVVVPVEQEMRAFTGMMT